MHSKKAFAPITCIELGSVTDVNPVHPLNVSGQMYFTVLGITTEVMPVQFSNALGAISVIIKETGPTVAVPDVLGGFVNEGGMTMSPVGFVPRLHGVILVLLVGAIIVQVGPFPLIL